MRTQKHTETQTQSFVDFRHAHVRSFIFSKYKHNICHLCTRMKSICTSFEYNTQIQEFKISRMNMLISKWCNYVFPRVFVCMCDVWLCANWRLCFNWHTITHGLTFRNSNAYMRKYVDFLSARIVYANIRNTHPSCNFSQTHEERHKYKTVAHACKYIWDYSSIIRWNCPESGDSLANPQASAERLLLS